MSISSLSGHEWLNRNSLRAYPLLEDADLSLADGSPFPKNVIVDALVVLQTQKETPLCVRSVSFTRKTVTVIFSEGNGGATLGYATGILGETEVNESVTLRSPSGLASGTVTFGQILDISERDDFFDLFGLHDFPEDVWLESRCVLYVGSPIVKSVRVPLQDAQIDGDLTLSFGNEALVTVTEELVHGQKETVIEVGLVSPEKFLPACYPTHTNIFCFCGTHPIVKINGVPRSPETNGISLVFGRGIQGIVGASELRNLITLLVEAEYSDVCSETPIIPDQYGRLGPEFQRDCPPATDYGLLDKGPPCLNPPPEPPLCTIEESSSSSE